MKIKVKGALFKHCVRFPVRGDDRNMARRLREVGNIISKDAMLITKVSITRTQPLALDQIYDIRICGAADVVRKIKASLKSRK